MGFKAWWYRHFGKNRQVVCEEKKVGAYLLAGEEFGIAVSYIYMGECVGFENLLTKWERAEEDYAGMGYRTLTLNDFVGYVNSCRSIDDVLRIPRKEGEEPIFHAKYYREHYLGKFRCHPLIKAALNGSAKQFTYEVPTTKHLKPKWCR